MSIANQVLLDGELIPAAQAKVSALSEGFLFGLGAFETIRVRNGIPCLMAAHHSRLTATCQILGLEPPPPPDELTRRITRLLAATRLPQAAVKIVRYRDLTRTAELITARTPPYTGADALRGLRVQTVTQGRREGRLTNHKTLNYLENLLSRKAAREAGFDEALFVTPDGYVLEGASSTLFIVKDGRAYTPPLDAGILPGVARARVLALIGPTRAEERPLTLQEVLAADECFLTNALLPVMPVCTIDAHHFRARAPETDALRRAYLTTPD